MQNRWKLIITISIIFGLAIAVVLPLYYFDILLPKKHNIYDYVYPNPLWFASTLSDLVAENDSSVHFCMTNFSNIPELVSLAFGGVIPFASIQTLYTSSKGN